MSVTQLSHHFATVQGIRLHYVACGDPLSPPLLLLAGFPQSAYAWRKVMPLLSAQYYLIAPDLPGQGDSDRPEQGYDTGALAQIVHQLMQHLGLQRYALAAHDVGAWVGWPYAASYAHEVTKLVLLDAGIPGITLPDRLPIAPDKAWRTWHFAFHCLPDLPEALIDGKERIYLEWFLRRKTASPAAFSEADIDEYLRPFTALGGLRAGLAYYRAVEQSAVQNRALLAQGKLTMPLLAVSADQGSIADMAQPLRATAEQVTGVTIAQCGHFIPEEQPAALADVLHAFLAG